MDIKEQLSLFHNNPVVTWHEHINYAGSIVYPNCEFAEKFMETVDVLGIDKVVSSVPVVGKRDCTFENFRGRSALDNYKSLTGEDYFALLSKNENVHIFVTRFSPLAAGEHFKKLLETRKNIYFDTTQFDTFNNRAAESTLEIIDASQLFFGSLSPFNYMAANLLRMEFMPKFDAERMKTNAKIAFKICEAKV